MTKTKEITFAVDYTTAGGRTYKAGSTHTINSPEARVLLNIGKARLADSAPAPVENKTQSGTPAADTAGDGTAAKTTTGKGK